jgi:DNA-binding Lrp family transcriptional regulator
MRKAFVLINADLGSEAALLSELRKVEGIVRANAVYGVYDIVAEIEAESEQEFKEIIFSRIRTLKQVRSTLTLAVI